MGLGHVDQVETQRRQRRHQRIERESTKKKITERPSVSTSRRVLQKYQLWKVKAGRVVSHGFRYAEFNCTGKKSISSTFRGCSFKSKVMNMHVGQKIKMQKLY